MNKTRLTFALLLLTISVVFSLHDFEREHMKDIHGIEINDELTFFKIHDLDDDDFWDFQELQYIFGTEHELNPHSRQVKRIIDRIYAQVDTNQDKFISVDEYLYNELAFLKPIKEVEEEQALVRSKKSRFSSREKVPCKYSINKQEL